MERLARGLGYEAAGDGPAPRQVYRRARGARRVVEDGVHGVACGLVRRLHGGEAGVGAEVGAGEDELAEVHPVAAVRRLPDEISVAPGGGGRAPMGIEGFGARAPLPVSRAVDQVRHELQARLRPRTNGSWVQKLERTRPLEEPVVIRAAGFGGLTDLDSPV
jgi:hypothetical protein